MKLFLAMRALVLELRFARSALDPQEEGPSERSNHYPVRGLHSDAERVCARSAPTNCVKWLCG
jgi:hypothetical protein